MGTISLISRLGRLIRRRSDHQEDEVECFSDHLGPDDAVDSRDLGLREVYLNQIVGSVGRYQDFDRQFRLKKDRPAERLEQIKQAMRDGKTLPPVDLYRIKNGYYVLDGNHRVAAAKEFGWDRILAHIIEYLPSEGSLENILYREKADFERKTGLYDLIELTEVGKFAYLLKQIQEHRLALSQVSGRAVTPAKAARDWHRTIYRPLLKIIESSSLKQAFPERTLGDLYVYITYHHWEKKRKRQYGEGVDEALPPTMEKFRALAAQNAENDPLEMKRVATAFVLLNVEAGKEESILDKLYSFREIRELHSIPGDYDVLVKLSVELDWLSSDSEAVGQFIQDHVRSMPGVIRTHTLIPITSRLKKYPLV